MKVKLTNGDALLRIRYDVLDKPKHLSGRRMTTLSVTLPSGEVLTAKVACHSGDQFSRKQGRKQALLKLLALDNQQAEEKTLKLYNEKPLKTESTSSLKLDSRKHYKLIREDRKLLFKLVCPEYSGNTPERRALRDRLLFDRLKARFEQESQLRKAVMTETDFKTKQ